MLLNPQDEVYIVQKWIALALGLTHVAHNSPHEWLNIYARTTSD